MTVYSIIVSVIALILAVIALKWKIAARAITFFCVTRFRKPTDEEIADCSKEAVSNILHIKK